MSEIPSVIMLLVLGVNHALHIGDIVVVYTLDNTLNFRQTARLFLFTLSSHVVNLLAMFLLVRLVLSISPEGIESYLTKLTGLIVAGIGISFFLKRIFEKKSHCTHHAHVPQVQSQHLLGVGILGGMIPCGEVIAIGLLSSTLDLFFSNMVYFLAGLILTLGILMSLSVSLGHALHAVRHKLWIRLLGPTLLIVIGLMKLFVS